MKGEWATVSVIVYAHKGLQRVYMTQERKSMAGQRHQTGISDVVKHFYLSRLGGSLQQRFFLALITFCPVFALY